MVILMLCSCSNESVIGSNDVTQNRFIYSAKWFGRLICYDLMDKKATIACPDPLCPHDDDCPVTNIQWYYVGDEYIAYSKRCNMNMEMKVYDLKTRTIKTISKNPRQGVMTIVDNYVYFSATQMEYDELGNPTLEIWGIYRYDVKKQELKKLNTVPITKAHNVYMYDNNLLYWVGEENDYTTDYEYNNVQQIDPVKRTPVIVEADYLDPLSTFSWTIKKELSNGKQEEVFQGVFSFGEDNPAAPKGMIFNSYHHNGGKTIFYMDYDKFEVKKLCVLPEGLMAFDLYTEFGSKRCLGNYVGIYIHNDGMTYEEAALTSESMMFIDINTGEYFILTP